MNERKIVYFQTPIEREERYKLRRATWVLLFTEATDLNIAFGSKYI